MHITSARRAVVAEEHQHSLDPAVDGVVDGQAELGKDGIDVLFHRPLSQHKPLRHRAVAEPGGQFGKHLAFSGCQPAERLGRARLSEQCLDHERIQHRPTCGDLVHRLAELVEVRNAFLQQIAAGRGTAVQQPRHVVGIRVLRQDNHPDIRMRGPHPPGQPNALIRRRRRHPHIGEQQRRMMLFDEFDGGVIILSDANDIHIRSVDNAR